VRSESGSFVTGKYLFCRRQSRTRYDPRCRQPKDDLDHLLKPTHCAELISFAVDHFVDSPGARPADRPWVECHGEDSGNCHISSISCRETEPFASRGIRQSGRRRAETARGPGLLVSRWFGPKQDFLHRWPAREGCNQIPPRLEAQGHEVDLSVHALKLHLYGWLGGIIQGPKV
jgi:hypothetical protein